MMFSTAPPHADSASTRLAIFAALLFCLHCPFATADQADAENEPSSALEQSAEADEGEALRQKADLQEAAALEEAAAVQEAAEQARLREIAQEVARREAQLEQLRYGQGIYAPQLQEAYADLGAYLAEVGDFERARQTYNEALQIARINTGLYSTEQLPIILAAAQADAALKDWEGSDDLQTLHWHISQRVLAPSDEAYLAAVKQYGDWQLRVLRENLLDLNFRGLMLSAEALSRFYGRTIEKLEATNTLADADLVDLLFSKTETDLALVRATATTPYTDFPGTVNPVIFKTRCTNVRDSRGNVQQRCTNIQIENPRYAQSQRNAKQSLVGRQVRGLTQAIERLVLLSDESSALTTPQRARIETKIAELEVEIAQLTRRARSRRLF